MDQLPLDGRITDLRAFARLGEEGVDLFMVDSTNAEVPGFTTPERDIGPALERVLRQQPTAGDRGLLRLPRAPRSAGALDAAVAHQRKVVYVGRSMVRNMGVARDLGYLRVPAQHLDRRNATSTTTRPSDVVIISTGSQGEPLSRAVTDGKPRPPGDPTRRPATRLCSPAR